jgi:hypothetical protein
MARPVNVPSSAPQSAFKNGGTSKHPRDPIGGGVRFAFEVLSSALVPLHSDYDSLA